MYQDRLNSVLAYLFLTAIIFFTPSSTQTILGYGISTINISLSTGMVSYWAGVQSSDFEVVSNVIKFKGSYIVVGLMDSDSGSGGIYSLDLTYGKLKQMGEVQGLFNQGSSYNSIIIAPWEKGVVVSTTYEISSYNSVGIFTIDLTTKDKKIGSFTATNLGILPKSVGVEYTEQIATFGSTAITIADASFNEKFSYSVGTFWDLTEEKNKPCITKWNKFSSDSYDFYNWDSMYIFPAKDAFYWIVNTPESGFTIYSLPNHPCCSSNCVPKKVALLGEGFANSVQIGSCMTLVDPSVPSAFIILQQTKYLGAQKATALVVNLANGYIQKQIPIDMLVGDLIDNCFVM